MFKICPSIKHHRTHAAPHWLPERFLELPHHGHGGLCYQPHIVTAGKQSEQKNKQLNFAAVEFLVLLFDDNFYQHTVV